MEETDWGIVDILLLALGKLGKKKHIAYKHIQALFQKLRGKKVLLNLIKSVELWVCAGLLIYSLILLFVGVRKRRLTLSLLLSAVFFACLSPFEKSIFLVFSKCLRHLFKDKNAKVIQIILSDKRIPLAILSFVITLISLIFLSLLKYLIFGVILFEIYHAIDGVVEGNNMYFYLAICAVSVVLVVLLGKVFNILTNTILALVFTSNGSYLFLTMFYVMTGYPKDFINFDIYALDSGRWGRFEFKVNFMLWLALFLFGLKIQFSFKAQ